jgi:hypothetical protein
MTSEMKQQQIEWRRAKVLHQYLQLFKKIGLILLKYIQQRETEWYSTWEDGQNRTIGSGQRINIAMV